MALRLEDRDLVLAYQAGDEEAFAELVREYRPQLLRHAHRRLHCPEAAEDAVQEALVRALRAMPRFNGNYLVGPWLHRIVSNVCHDESNRRRRETNKVERVASNDQALKPPLTTESELGLDTDDTKLAEAVDNLSESYREALTLRFVDELSYEEVAEVTGVSEVNARARVSRARSAVRAALKLAAMAPVALGGLLRRGERAAAAMASQPSPGGARAALHSAMPMLAETAPMVSRAAAATANAATVGVPVVAKAAVGFGLATAVIAPTVDSPIHKATDRVLPDSVMEVLSPLAVELPAPDAPVVVTDTASATGLAGAVDVDVAGSIATQASSDAAAVAATPETEASRAAEAAEATSTENGAETGTPAATAADDAPTEAATAGDAETAVEETVQTEVVVEPATSVATADSVQDVKLTFTPSGADRYDVAGALTLTVTTVTTTTNDGVESTESATSAESIAVISPSTASLSVEDPAIAQRRFSALLVFAPGDDGASAELRLAARGTANDDGTLAMTGFFTAAGTEALPLAARGDLGGTLSLDEDGTPVSLSITLTP